MPVPGSEQPLPAFEFKLSRNQLMDDLAARMSADRQTVFITQEGDVGALMDELTGLKREVTAARNVRYTTPAGGHDDIGASNSIILVNGCKKIPLMPRFSRAEHLHAGILHQIFGQSIIVCQGQGIAESPV